MAPFTRILVDVDALSAAHPALDRAAGLARRCGARLRLVDVLTIPAGARGALPESIEREMIAARERRLAELAAGAGVPADFRVLRGRPAIAIIEEVIQSAHDLLIRAHPRDLAAGPRSYGAIDMQLFRKCPCPVWAVGPGAQPAAPRILAAVDAKQDDEGEDALNRKIVGTAKMLADFQGGSLRVIHAWTAFGEEVLKSHQSPAETDAYVAAARETAAGELHALEAHLGGAAAGARFELVKGLPEDCIPDYVVAEGIDTVVLGTVARTGIPGLLIGNTAERLLQRLLCSVVAVKPDGFVSPVTVPAG